MSAGAPPYRPALDGLRAVAIIAVVIYHFGDGLNAGGWLGVDLFFVLSGFLITTLLLNERQRWGRVDLLRFWGARLRRLLPALVTVLLAVVVLNRVVTAPSLQKSVNLDVFASLFYVSNWRFLASEEMYFSDLGLPSPLRHTWSLGIEEQFYLLFPVLLGVVALFTRTRRSRALVLLAIAAASAVLMATLFTPGVEPSRVYYGTDTRAFELLLGAAGATWLHHVAFADAPRPRLLAAGAWSALALVVAAMLFADPEFALLYRGGLVVICLAALWLVVAAASATETSFQRALSARPLVWLGVISYPLYLWHWVVWVYSRQVFPEAPFPVLVIGQIVISVLLAWLTWRFIERPVRARDSASLIPQAPKVGRPLVALAVPVLVAAATLAIVIPKPEPTVATGRSVILHPVNPLGPDEIDVQFIGNSIPASLFAPLADQTFPFTRLSSTTDVGCDPFPDGIVSVLDDGSLATPSKDCQHFREIWDETIAEREPDVALFFVPQSFVRTYDVNGQRVAPGSRGHDAVIRAALDHVRDGALAAGAERFAISTLACHDVTSFGNREQESINDIDLVSDINEVARSWAQEHEAGVIDTFEALCSDGFRAGVNGVPLYGDGLHFTRDSAPIMWAWMMSEIHGWWRGD